MNWILLCLKTIWIAAVLSGNWTFISFGLVPLEKLFVDWLIIFLFLIGSKRLILKFKFCYDSLFAQIFLCLIKNSINASPTIFYMVLRLIRCRNKKINHTYSLVNEILITFMDFLLNWFLVYILRKTTFFIWKLEFWLFFLNQESYTKRTIIKLLYLYSISCFIGTTYHVSELSCDTRPEIWGTQWESGLLIPLPTMTPHEMPYFPCVYL